jgi:hypothetical protein
MHSCSGCAVVSSLLEPLEPRRLMSSAVVDPVIEWNNVLIGVLRADRTLPGPGWASRNAAIMHAAIFDAADAIDGSYQPFLVSASASKSLPLDAAIASAGWRVLSTLYPLQKSTVDDALVTSLKRVKNGPAEDKAVKLGIAVADQILADRANDGANIVVPYTPGSAPGDWHPTEPDFTPAWGPGWGNVEPFSMLAGDQFRPAPPPALDSAAYAAAFNEVKSLGAKNSTTRTADQTQIGVFWGYDRAGTGAPPALYNQLTQVIAIQRHNSVIENARLFALANIAMADAGIAAWDCKFVDNLWRPITAIRQADSDGNPLTTADPTWEPLGAPGGGVVPNFTPPFPAYVSGHATFGAAVCEVIADFYHTDKIHFTLGSDELPGVTRSYKSLSQAAAENGISRIYLGIHWQFDNTEGQKLGRDVADYVFANTLEEPSHGRCDSIQAPKVTYVTASADNRNQSVVTLFGSEARRAAQRGVAVCNPAPTKGAPVANLNRSPAPPSSSSLRRYRPASSSTASSATSSNFPVVRFNRCNAWIPESLKCRFSVIFCRQLADDPSRSDRPLVIMK